MSSLLRQTLHELMQQTLQGILLKTFVWSLQALVTKTKCELKLQF